MSDKRRAQGNMVVVEANDPEGDNALRAELENGPTPVDQPGPGRPGDGSVPRTAPHHPMARLLACGKITKSCSASPAHPLPERSDASAPEYNGKSRTSLSTLTTESIWQLVAQLNAL